MTSLENRLAAIPGIARVVVLATTGSTNDDARSLAAGGAPGGTLVVARAQTAGRGRLGRVWESPVGTGAYLSILLRPNVPADRSGRYALAVAVSVCRACRGLGAAEASIKWPNDVRTPRGKLAGILSEMRTTPRGAELVVGIGINVLPLPGDVAARIGRSTTSLRAEGAPGGIAPDGVVTAVAAEVFRDLAALSVGRWDDVAGEFLRYAPGARDLRVRLADGRDGVTAGLDETGALRVATGDGITLVHGGDSIEGFGD